MRPEERGHMPYGISNDKSQISNLRSEICHSERSEEPVAYKVQAHCPRSEGLGPRVVGCFTCLDAIELVRRDGLTYQAQGLAPIGHSLPREGWGVLS